MRGLALLLVAALGLVLLFPQPWPSVPCEVTGDPPAPSYRLSTGDNPQFVSCEATPVPLPTLAPAPTMVPTPSRPFPDRAILVPVLNNATP